MLLCDNDRYIKSTRELNPSVLKQTFKGKIMTFAFIPKGKYKIGQIITVFGEQMIVESYLHTGRNVTVRSLAGAPRFKRIVCICTDSKSI